MLILVCGSRNWTDKEAIRRRIRTFGPGASIIHGNAPGADTLAAEVALELGLPCTPFPADWDRHGRAAGPIRNRQMLDQEPGMVLAFLLPGSRGTKDTVEAARRRGIQTWVLRGEPVKPAMTRWEKKQIDAMNAERKDTE